MTLHILSTASFIRTLMREARHYRRMKQRRGFTLMDVAAVTGHNHMYIGWWTRGRATPQLHEALNVLEAVKTWAA